MRFMYLVSNPGPSGQPSPELLEAMHKLADREIKAGRMLENGGADADCDRRARSHR